MEEKTIKQVVSGYKIIFNLTRHGQDEPYKSDQVRVEGEICLPLRDDTLDPSLCFEKRIKPIMGRYLTSREWGYCDYENEIVRKSGYYLADTWQEAFKKAEECLQQEIQPLISALQARHSALLKAEEIIGEEKTK